MPTGAGKSLCYQIPALMFDGITIVISPLIALMHDQVTNLVELGVRAAYINSSLTMSQLYTVIRNAANGVYKLIYVAPERLDSEIFLKMAANADISMVTVDEAHCIAQWGQDFRPSYLKIPEFVSLLPRRPVVTAFTATATEQVRNDIKKLLVLDSPYELVTGFDRKNLYFEVRKPDDKYHDLKSLIKKYDAEGRSGIVYCSTRKEVENICEKLKADGFSASRYHAGLTEGERRANQEDLIYDRVRIMVATNAFGMGIDKSNLSFVIHYNMPKDLESYYQEAGRAGRDGSPSDCILFYSGRDVNIAKFLINKSFEESELDPPQAQRIKERDLKKLNDMIFYSTSQSCLRRYMLGYFGEKSHSECGNCSVCCSDETFTDITLDAQKIMSCIFRSGQRYGISTVSKILLGDSSAQITERGLDKLTTYGIMKDRSRQYIYDISMRLADMGYTEITDDEYRVAKLTSKALPVLKGEIKVSARVHLDVIHKDNVSYDRELFERLRMLRAAVARINGVPPYNIFTDATLSDMAAKMPQNEAEFLDIQGVGKLKLSRFGDRFIDEICEYIKEKGISPRPAKKRRSDLSASVKALAERADKLMPANEDLTITSFIDSLIKQSGIDKELIKCSHIRNAMTDWLESEGLLKIVTDDAGHSSKAVTKTSAENGIYAEQHISKAGAQYLRICYSPKAQQMLLSSLPEIARYADEQNKEE